MRPEGDIRIRAGQLRHPIQVNALGPTSPPTYNDAGPVQVYAAFANGLMAQIGPDRASLVLRSGQQVTETITPITIRYLPGLTAQMQIVQLDTGDIYQIQGIEDIERRRVVMEIECILFGKMNTP